MAHEGAEVADLVKRWAPSRPRWRLYSVSGAGALKRLDEWPTPDDPSELIENIEARADRAAKLAGAGNPQTFELEAIDVDAAGAEKVLACEQWKQHAEAGPGGMFALELANDAGERAQMMRHNEALFRLATAAQMSASQVQERMIRMLGSELEKSQKQNLRAYRVIDEVYAQNHLRELETQTLARTHQLKEQALEKIGALMPLVGHAITKKVNPSGLALASATVAKSFFESLSPEQLETIFQTLGPEQRAQVMTLYQDFIADKEKRAASAATTATTATTKETAH